MSFNVIQCSEQEGGCIRHDLPDRRFHQSCWPLLSKAALNLLNTGDFSPGPDLSQSPGNVGKGGKALTPGMQEEQVVVALSGECPFRANPVDASLDACQAARCLRAALFFFIFLG